MSQEPNPADYARIGAYVVVATPLEPADLCFVFGTRNGVEPFADVIADHFHRKFYSRIVITGGATLNEPIPESDVIKERLVARGVPDEAILCERSSANCLENVVQALPLIDAEFGLGNISSLIAVGKISSARRYLMTLKRHWPAARRMFLPVNYFGVPDNQWWQSEPFRTRVLGEWRKIPDYLARGHLCELDAEDGLIG